MIAISRRLLFLIGGGIVAVFALGRCDGRAAADLDWNARNIATLNRHVRVQRQQVAQAIAAKDSAAQRVTAASSAVDTAQAVLAPALDSARAALADTAANPDTLRARLARVTAAAHGLSLRVDALQAQLLADAAAHLAERAAFTATIAAQDAVIAAQAAQIRRLTPSPLRRLWAVTCTATLAGTGAAAGSLIPAPVAPFVGAAVGVAVSEGPCR